MPPKKRPLTDQEILAKEEEVFNMLLNARLEAIYTVLTVAGLAGASDGLSDGMLGLDFAERLLPELVINTAVVTEMIPDPPEGNVPFGNYSVLQEYKDELMERLAKPIEELRQLIANEKRALLEWRQPNPRTTIKEFCKFNHFHHSTSFITFLAPEASVDVPCPTTQRRVLRLLELPNLKAHKKPNKSQREFATLMHRKMVAHDPKRFGSIVLDDLLWLPKE